jgi:hypothetical protein
MNDPVDGFEIQLRRLKAAAPAPELRERVAAAVATGPVPIPGRASAWSLLLERWVGPSPSLTWKFAAAAVALAIACAAILVARIEVAPTAPMGTAAPVIRLNDHSQGSTAAVSQPVFPSPSTLRLARAASESQAVMDEGFVRDESGALERRVRMQFIDTLEWRDSETGAQVVVSYPREELFSAQVRAF